MRKTELASEAVPSPQSREWRRRSADVHIYQELRQGIEAGTLPPGTKLPTERTLAVRHSVGRKLVRGALERLRKDGLIERRVGSGSFVSALAGLRAIGASAEPPSISPLDAIEARRVLEVGAIELVVTRATDDDFARIQSRLDAVAATDDASAFRALMFALNLDIIRATRNPLLIAMYEMLIAARAKAGWDRLAYLVEQPEQRAQSVAIVRELLVSLRRGDGRRAATLRHRSLSQMIQTIMTVPEDA
jgi:GntR family uxuAB operon transcriptional repressor